jgi:hypothetical protein
MTSIPFVIDDAGTERDLANGALRDLGLTQASLASQTAANRAAADHVIATNLAPLGTPANTNVPGPLGGGNYQQPNTANPAPRPSGTVTQADPMGL